MPKLKATIDRFEGELAVLVFADNQTLTIKQEFLPTEIKAGDVVFLQISQDESATINQQKLAKDILQEILNKPTDET